MANIKLSKKLFEKEIGKLDEKMQDRISMFGTSLESISDEEIEINNDKFIILELKDVLAKVEDN